MNKDMLNEALEKALTESYEELTGQDIPDYDFSDGFEDKMARLISEQDGNADKKRRRGIILFFAAAAAVAVICAWAAMGSGLRPDRHGDYHDSTIIQETTSADKNETVTATTVTGGETAVTHTAVTSAEAITQTADKTETTASATKAPTVTSPSAAGNNSNINNTNSAATSAAGNTNAVTTAAAIRTTSAAQPVRTTTAAQPVRTTSAVPQTFLTTDTQPVVTTTTAIIDERSFEMKKMAAFASALMTAATAVSASASASDGIPRPPYFSNVYYEEHSYDAKCIIKMANGDFDLDLNQDGTFDIFDVYAHYRSVFNAGAPKEMRERVRLNGDYNHDGYIDNYDTQFLVDYYLLYNDIDTQWFDPMYFRSNCPDSYYDLVDEVYSGDERITDYTAYLQELGKDYNEWSDVIFQHQLSSVPLYNSKEMWIIDIESLHGIIHDDIDLDGLMKQLSKEQAEKYGPKMLVNKNEGEEYAVETSRDWSFLYDRKAESEQLLLDNAYLFSRLLMDRANAMERSYEFFEQAMDEKIDELDINLDGRFDYEDIAYIFAAQTLDSIMKRPRELRHTEEEWALYNSLDEETKAALGPNFMKEEFFTPDPEDEALYNAMKADGTFDRAIEATKITLFGFYKYDMAFTLDLLRFYTKYNPILPEYKDDAFFDTVREGFSRFGIGGYFKSLDKNEYTEKNYTLYERYYNELVEAIDNGTKSIPEINGDGVVDINDIYDINVFLREKSNNVAREDSILPERVLTNIETNCDFNDDGVSGDIYDMSISNIYLMLYLDKFPNEVHEHYDEYVEQLKAAKTGARQNISYAYASNAAMMSSMNIDRSGDANCDGETDLADAIFIMQSMANPDKYSLTEHGRFNGDVYETGHGITANDALEIQNRLLNK